MKKYDTDEDKRLFCTTKFELVSTNIIKIYDQMCIIEGITKEYEYCFVPFICNEYCGKTYNNIEEALLKLVLNDNYADDNEEKIHKLIFS